MAKLQKAMGTICNTLSKLALLASKETAQSFSLESQRMQSLIGAAKAENLRESMSIFDSLCQMDTI